MLPITYIAVILLSFLSSLTTLIGIGIAALEICLILHKRWYGTYRLEMNNFPFSTKLKKNLGLNDDYIVKRRK